MPTILCIRHGQSTSNAGDVTHYPKSIPLTDLGRRQAERLVDVVVEPPRLVVVSTYERSMRTAVPLCRRFPDVPVAVWPVQEFTYLAPARYDGTRRIDRQGAVTEYWQRLDPHSRDGEGAETFVEFWDRVEAFVARCRTMEGLVAVISHGQFLRGVLQRLLCGPDSDIAGAMARFRAFRKAITLRNAACFTVWLSPEGDRISPIATGHLPPDWLST